VVNIYIKHIQILSLDVLILQLTTATLAMAEF
jgi:hypothetical protein